MISVELEGREAAVIRIHSMGPKLLNAVQFAVERSGEMVAARAIQKTSGEVLKVRTGRLHRSIHQQMTKTSDGGESRIGTNVEYAPVHEYGGTFRINAHIRNITQVFGHVLNNPVAVQVRAYSATYPERSFLRSALIELLPTIHRTINAAIGEAVE